jgi:hypothetical protein
MLLFFLIIAITVTIPLAAEQRKHTHSSVLLGLRLAVREALENLVGIVIGRCRVVDGSREAYCEIPRFLHERR